MELKDMQETAPPDGRPYAGFWKECRKLANILTLSRILLIPVFLWMMLRGKPVEAFLVFLFAGLTDVLDGLAARLWQQRSRLGLWLDPVADKLLMTSAFVLLGLPAVSRPNAIPVWVVGIVIGRDVLIALATVLLMRWKGRNTFYPSLMGKVSTVAQVLTVLLVLLFNCVGTSPFILSWMYQTVVVAAVLSGGHYAWLAWPRVEGREKS